MQFGFMPGGSTTDAIFILRQMQEKHHLKRKAMYAAFVDLEKDFDRVRNGLSVNVDKTKTMVSSAKYNKISVSNPKYPGGVGTFVVGANSDLYTSQNLQVHNKCPGQTVPERSYLLLLHLLRKLMLKISFRK